MTRRGPTQSKFAVLHAESFCCKTRVPRFLALRARVLCTLLIFLSARHADCVHIVCRNAACNHQSSSHIRKRCGTCLRPFGPQRDLLLCISESNQVFFFECLFSFVHCRDGKTLCAKVTAIYVSLPLVAVAALLHFPIAWLIQRLYRRTSFSEALDEYRKQINCKPFPGPDGTHPRNQGLQVLTLRGLWMHFESFSSHQQRFCRARVLTQLARFTLMLGSEWTDRDKVSSFCSRQQRTVRENTCPNLFNSGFILERNMHFVVANIVRPLTQSKRVSFVSLWGGRQVDYFVSLGMLLAKLFLICFLPTFVHLCQAPPSLPYVLWKVPFLGHQLSALRAFHPMPCVVQRGPHFLD